MGHPRVVIKQSADLSFNSNFRTGLKPYTSHGTASLRWGTTANTLVDGVIIDVITDGSIDFGLADDTLESLEIIGDTCNENNTPNNFLASYVDNQYISGRTSSKPGLPNDPNSAFLGAQGCTKTTFTRHPNITSALKFNGYPNQTAQGVESGVVTWPIVFNKNADRTPTPGSRFFVTWMAYDYCNGKEAAVLPYTSIDGTFQLNGNTIPSLSDNLLVGGVVAQGERVSLANLVGKTGFAQVMNIDTTAKLIYLSYEADQSWTNAEAIGLTITGTVSGAVCHVPDVPLWTSGETYANNARVRNGSNTFYKSIQDNNIGHALTDTAWWVLDPNYYLNEGSVKAARILQNSTWAIGQNVTTLIAGTSGNLSQSVFYSSTNPALSSYASNSLPTLTWRRRLIWVDYSGSAATNGKLIAGQRISGFTDLINVHDKSTIRNDIRPILGNWGAENNVGNGYTCVYSELKCYTDVFCAFISESPTYAGMNIDTSEPLMLYRKRNSKKVSFKLSKGAFTSISGKYLYVMKDPITPINTTGMLLEL